MKRNRLILFALMLIGLLNAQKVCAWDGNTPASVTSQAFYLYNVGTGKFIQQGSVWGTAAIVDKETGLKFKNTKSTGSGSDVKYYMLTSLENGYFAFSDGYGLENPGYFFFDQTTEHPSAFTFTAVTGETGVYTLSVTSTDKAVAPYKGTFYLSVGDDGICYGKNTSGATVTDNDKWIIVTEANMETNFNNTQGTEANPAPAMHLLIDPGFYRNNYDISEWKLGEDRDVSLAPYYAYMLTPNGDNSAAQVTSINSIITPTWAQAGTKTVTLYTYTITCTYYTNSNQTKTNTHTQTITSPFVMEGLTTENASKTVNVESEILHCSKYGNHVATDTDYGIKEQTITLTKIEDKDYTSPGYTYYVGNGYDVCKDTWSKQESLPCGLMDEDGNTSLSSEKYGKLYGGDWCANIHGTEGSISQRITITRAGWYKVSAKGFSNDGTGYLFAYAGGTNQTNTDKYGVQQFEVPSGTLPATYVKASRYVNSLLSQSVTLYVDANETLTFGAYIKEGEGTETSWTCFDDFSLYYLGEGELNLIIDEENEKLDNINGQVNTTKNQTLRLIRDFKQDKWNSLVLPVNLTAQQIKTAFGTGTKLSSLNRTELEGKRIFFEKEDLTDDDRVAITAGQLYIIKPQNAMPQDQNPKTRKLNDDKTTITTDVDGNNKSSYYTINQVTLKESVPEIVEKGVGSEEDAGIKMVGTYLYKQATGNDHSIPANSYILSDGIWYYHTAGVHNVKGLRGWIQTNQATAETKFFINGVEEGEATAIEGIENSMEVSKKRNSNIYNLNGQLVRSNSTSVEGLDKGIYIIGGKKVVVK
ncbi:MAG: hypothetical protein ACI3ZB_06615 [Prevotella sp.]